jgi:hypothetical protein
MKRGGYIRRRKPWIVRAFPVLDKVYTTLRPKRKRRSASEFARIYGSRKRVRFVAGLPCIVCNATPCQNAHTPHPSAGMGRKADAESIVPLCAKCHDELHRSGVDSFQAAHSVNLAMSALETDALWQRIGGDA